MYRPFAEPVFNKAMIQFDGHLVSRQFMPKKPIKWGSNFCVRAIQTLATVWRSMSTVVLTEIMEYLHWLQGGGELGAEYLRRYHHFFADNYFTSVHLADDLHQADIYHHVYADLR